MSSSMAFYGALYALSTGISVRNSFVLNWGVVRIRTTGHWARLPITSFDAMEEARSDDPYFQS